MVSVAFSTLFPPVISPGWALRGGVMKVRAATHTTLAGAADRCGTSVLVEKALPGLRL